MPTRLLATLAVALLAAPAGAATIVPDSPTSLWTPLAYPGLMPDFSDDQRTGITEADIVGNATTPAFYTLFDDAGTPSLTDGFLGFRVRVGADKNPSGFDHFFGVGVELGLDGDDALDLFLAVENSGNPDRVGIFDPGTGANTSPSTTSIVSTALVSYAHSAGNYDWSPVDGVIDPGAPTDVDGDGNNDYFLTFVIPFADIVAQVDPLGTLGFDQDSVLRYVIGTSTQPNALNQDLGGPDGGTTSTETWATLGAITNPISASGTVPTPEPGSAALLGLGLVALAVTRRRP